MTTNAITFGVHNPTLTTKYANQFGARGHKVEDASYQHDLTDSLIINDSYHIHIPNTEVDTRSSGCEQEEFSHFVVSPYDSELGETDTDNFEVIHTFDEVVCYLENPIHTTQYEEDGDMVVGVKCKAPFSVDGEGDSVYCKETNDYVLYFTVS